MNAFHKYLLLFLVIIVCCVVAVPAGSEEKKETWSKAGEEVAEAVGAVGKATKESFDAKVIGTDPRTDIALIKINTKRKLSVAKLGSSGDLQVGEWVAAFGNPYGHGHSMSKGIVSAIGREIEELNMLPFIQTDASINPGNSIPANISPIPISAMRDRMTTSTEGGMIEPRDPPAQIVPDIRPLS